MFAASQTIRELFWASRLYNAAGPGLVKRVRFALRSLFYLQASTAWFRFLKAARQSRPSAMVIDLLQLPHRPFFDRRLTSVERVLPKILETLR